MKKTLLLSAAMLVAVITLAQNPAQTLSNPNPWNDRPDLIIKGEELKNFPGGELTEMLLGRLPGLSQLNDAVLKVSFVVDGFVWPSIESLNINNIEEVAYYRGGLNSKLGVQNTGRSGVLYITTKTAKYNQPLNVSVNTLLGNNVLKKENDKERTTLQSYHVALAQGFDKVSWRAAATYNQHTRNEHKFDFTHQFQFNGDIRYNPLKWLEMGLNGNYAPLKGDSPVDKNLVLISEQYAKYKQDNWNGMFYAKITPLKGLVNESRAIKSSLVSDYDTYSILKNDYNKEIVNSEIFSYAKYTNFSVLNDLSYRFGIDEDKIKIKAATVFQYRDMKSKGALIGSTYFSHSNSPANSSYEYYNKLKFKTYAFTGDLSINFYDILNVIGGVRRDSFKGDANKGYYSPYYYADLNLKTLLLKAVNEIDELSLFGSNGQYKAEMEIQGVPGFTGGIVDGSMVTGNFNADYDKMKMQSYGVKTRLFNRVTLSGDWFKNDSYLYILQSLPDQSGYGTNYISIFPVEYSGWRVWSSADILRDAFKWSAGINVFKNKTEITPDGQLVILVAQSLKAAVQAGMQQHFSYANFSLNMNANAYLNHQVLKHTNVGGNITTVIEKADFINLNYLSLGYNFKDQLGAGTLKNLNVSFVARNLTQKKKHIENNLFSKTVGIAINANF